MRSRPVQPAIDPRDLARVELERRKRLRRAAGESLSLAQFVRLAWHVVEPGTDLAWNWHIDAICEHLEAVTAGRIRRLIINVPPGHMKSLIVSVFWPAWIWLRDPGMRMLTGSYADDLATRDSVRTRDLLASGWYQREYAPAWKFKTDQNLKSWYRNDRYGERMTFSVGGRLTGFRGHGIVVDDPVNVKDAYSAAALKEAEYVLTKALPTRLNDPKTGWIVMIMQRVSELDPTGVFLRKGGWDHLCLPSEYDPKIAKPTSIGWRDPRTTPGELLFEEMFPAAVLEDLKITLGARDFAAQHSQRPVPAEGNMFKASWFQYFDVLPPKFDELAQSWDFTFGSKSDGASYVCGAVWGRIGSQRYRIEEVRARMTFPEMLTAFRSMSKRWPAATAKFVEAKANGQAIIDTLTTEIGGIIPIEPDGSKQARAAAVSPIVEAGNLLLPRWGSWTEDYIAEMCAFPFGQANDRVDETSQLLRRWATAGGFWDSVAMM